MHARQLAQHAETVEESAVDSLLTTGGLMHGGVDEKAAT
jgi:hypothetical protein